MTEKDPKIRRDRDLYRILVENTEDIVYLTDADGTLSFISGQTERYGLKPEDAIGRQFLTFVHPDDRARMLEAFEDTIVRGLLTPVEFRFVANGEIYWFEERGKILFDDDGKPSGVNGILRDVTERKRAEEEKRVLEEQLHQSRKMEAVGQLAGGVAHNFNNLLQAIIGFSEMIATESDDPDIAELAERIELAGRRGADLTRQLLAFSRKGRYSFRELDVHDVIGEVVKLVAATIDRRIRIECNFNAGDSYVKGDDSLLMHAILNLVINARDALPAGGRITIETGNISFSDKDLAELALSPGRHVFVSVADNGVGMDNLLKDRIFDPFFTTKEVDKGTGLGLSCVYGCVKSHFGDISVKSAVGKGSVFTIFLPVASGAPAVSTAGPAAPMRRVGGGRVLVIDDDEDVRLLAGLNLKSGGFESVAFSDPERALAYYKKESGAIDLVLLDITMPQVDGRECIRRLREIDPRARILVMSGHAVESVARELRGAETTGFIQKPWEKSQLIRTVCDAFERRT